MLEGKKILLGVTGGIAAYKAVERRLAAAAGEIAVAREYTYTIVNDTVEHSVQTLAAIVSAEHARTCNNLEKIDEIIKGA